MQQPPNKRPASNRPSTGSKRPASNRPSTGSRRPANASARPSGTKRSADSQAKPTGTRRPAGTQAKKAGVSRPANAQARPANAQPRRPSGSPAAGGARPVRRPMTRQEYEALQQRRRMQNIRAFAVLGAVAVALIVAVVLILRPHPAKDQTTTQVVSAAATAQSGEGFAIDEDETGGASAATTLSANDPLPTVTAVPTPRPGGLRSVRLRVIGDVMVCQSQLDAYKDSGYDFHPEFDFIKEMLQNADYTMANMEGTVGKYNDKKYSGYPLFNCPETILEALKDSGVDFLTLANNHMLDRWFNGVKNTVGWVRQYGFDYVGAYLSPEERNTPVIYDVGGIKIGFVAYTHTTNTQEKVSDKDAVEYGVPYLYKADIEADIKRLKDAGAEVVIAFPHWGKEYIKNPDDNQKKYARRLAEAGADIILGSHSHTVQNMGYQSVTDASGRTRQVFITFSLGNFLSDHVPVKADDGTYAATDAGIIVDFTINEHEDGTFTCDDVGYIPTYCWQPTQGDARVLPSGKYLQSGPAGMTEEAHNRLVETYQQVTETIGSEFPVLEG